MGGRVMKKRGGKKNVPAGNAAPLKSRVPAWEGDPLILLAESRALDHVWALLHDATVPEIPEGLEGILPLQSIHRELCEIRETMKRYTVWDIEISLESRGILPGYLKALRSNLRHLIWRMQMVTEGDATPQENSIGKFSGVFDGLIRRMEGLREKEAELCALRGENADGKRTGASPPQMCRPGDAPYRAGGRGGLAGALDREAFIFRAFDDLYAAFAQGKWCCLAVV
ncbi:MAG: hypothetical protein LBI91_02845, partial [Spirochaetaceae bacterium]|nr:hypothetical protein [Spirochaetaceae bacterium]